MASALVGKKGSGGTTTEIYLQDDTEQAGAADADLAIQSEQRAMQELHRFQKLSLQVLEQPDDPPPLRLRSVCVPICLLSHFLLHEYGRHVGGAPRSS